MEQQYTAVLRGSRISPRKMRYVVDLVRDKNVNAALDILRFTPNKGSYPLIKLIKSAIANAVNRTPGVDADSLKIARLTVDTGPTIQRWRPTTMGRAVPIKKRTSHITVALVPFVEEAKPTIKKPHGKMALKKGTAPVTEHDKTPKAVEKPKAAEEKKS